MAKHQTLFQLERLSSGEPYLFALLQQQLQSVIGSFGHHFIPLCFILALGVVHVDAEV